MFKGLFAGVLLISLSLSAIKFGTRPSSSPYISGDTFRAVCSMVLDEEGQKFDTTKLRAGDTIFVGTSYLSEFFTIYHPQIRVPYILISHNNDLSAPAKFRQFLDDPKLIVWFAQNCDSTEHAKLVPIPIGLSNKHWAHSCQHDGMIETLRKQFIQQLPAKKILLYANFDPATSPNVRNSVYAFFRDKPYATFVARKPFRDYLLDMAQSKFVLSPHGNGLDCHRTWEALYVGSYPVVKTSTLDPLYANLPVLIVRDWSELSSEFLEQKYREMVGRKYNYDKLFMPYWLGLLEKRQERYSLIPPI